MAKIFSAQLRAKKWLYEKKIEVDYQSIVNNEREREIGREGDGEREREGETEGGRERGGREGEREGGNF